MWCDIDPLELSAFVDGEVSRERAAELAAHAATCSSCKDELARARRIDDAVRRPGPTAGGGLDALRADLAHRVDGIRRRRWMRIGVPAAAAAAAIVVGITLGVRRPPAGREPGLPRAAAVFPEIDALELESASLRLTLVAENPDPAVRRKYDARLDALMERIERLRAANGSGN